ncbi:MAG: YifB family Mg chelatase-like AAA ATPase, partial [Clostridia bacterium]|nr:YifB family Mg chelatase-like AAA ATPase [Clostridia bacterium]
MLSSLNSVGLNGIEIYKVNLQVDLSKGLPAFDIVGLAGTTIKEARERVRSAVKNSGFGFPAIRITCNLAPADIRKDSSVYDLPISIGMLAAMGEVSCDNLEDYVIIGELSLDGAINKVNGVLPMVIGARDIGYTKVILPFDNANEARFVDGIDIFPCKNLNEAVSFLNGDKRIEPLKTVAFNQIKKDIVKSVDFANIKGQQSAKRALEIAAAGNHNVLFIGPAGSGKTMLARSMPSILPDMTFDEALEVTKIHSISGELGTDGIIYERPFRAPHHGVSQAALVGGGTNARPGEISMAH